ncbi:anaerobic ribonucleoside-triphosphate reductase activating protein [Candidatus Saccharibacteria bacterium]|nr:MAG: anaerobic ribonucleoside-triphosphate reductase activating protein [Candidatus Saccharibacteria bacterium]
MTKQPTKSKQPPYPTCNIHVGGIQKLSLVDYPGHVAAALFLAGCNMRCGYCHNPELVLPERLAPKIPLDHIFEFLKSRVGRLDGAVISGGEPTVQKDLPELCRRIKALGYDIKLDTNGTHPDMVRQMVEEKTIDFIAMDVKGPLDKYIEIAARPIDLDAIVDNIRLMIDSGIDHEFRTTVVREQLTVDDFERVGQLVKGAKRFALQHFNTGITVSPQFENYHTFTEDEFQQAKKIIERYVKQCVIH